jgi:hypothetical protein
MTYAIADFKTYFSRDFVFSSSPTTGITDADLNRAFSEATMNFNPTLFETPNDQTAFFYLAAHMLCTNLQAALQGKNSVPFFPVASRSVGAVLEAYSIPAWVSENPILSGYSTTRYGQQYLLMLYPRMIGRVTVHQGATTA